MNISGLILFLTVISGILAVSFAIYKAEHKKS